MKNNEDIERSVIINKLIDTYGFEKYLEIGVNDASNFLKINCKYKDCVDPFISFSTDYNINKDIHLLTEDDIIKYRFIEENILTHKMTSDDFFEITDKKYDLIFIDGDHTEEQVTKDIKHALFRLEENGRKDKEKRCKDRLLSDMGKKRGKPHSQRYLHDKRGDVACG